MSNEQTSTQTANIRYRPLHRLSPRVRNVESLSCGSMRNAAYTAQQMNSAYSEVVPEPTRQRWRCAEGDFRKGLWGIGSAQPQCLLYFLYFNTSHFSFQKLYTKNISCKTTFTCPITVLRLEFPNYVWNLNFARRAKCVSPHGRTRYFNRRYCLTYNINN